MSKKPFLWQLESVDEPKSMRSTINKEQSAIRKLYGGKKKTPIYRITEPMERKGYLGQDVKRAILKKEGKNEI